MKIGIISFYHNCVNYGGLAQTYALCHFLTQKGFNTELISYKRLTRKSERISLQNRIKKAKALSGKAIFQRILFAVVKKLLTPIYKNRLEKRYALVAKFRNECIPHSEKCSINELNSVCEKYDVLITGSDQVWKPGVVDDAFVFNFITDKQRKKIFSYATSVAVNTLNEEYVAFMAKSLQKYSAVSLREVTTANYFKEHIYKNTESCVDPTLLLSEEDWNSVVAKPVYNGDYVFSYILGESLFQRKQIKKFAQKKNLKLVTIPHIHKAGSFAFNSEDLFFGDIKAYDVGFPEFLSLIKNARYVLTDSFHACVFSFVFKRDFYVYERPTRNPQDAMNVRIYDLLDMYGLQDRLIKGNQMLQDGAKEIDYSIVCSKVGKFVKKSKNYLDSVLDIAK